MDFIKQDIESKKRLLSQVTTADDSNGDRPPPKYLKRADIERQRVEEHQLQAAKDAQDKLDRAVVVTREKVEQRDELEAGREASTSNLLVEQVLEAVAVEQAGTETFNISNEDAVRRLRNKGQPIRLFGETDKERRLRVRALELIEERTEGQLNEFMRAMERTERGLDLDEATGKKEDKQVERKGKKAGEEDVLVDMALVKSNPHKVYPQIYHALKRVLKEWEQSMNDRPEAVRRSTQGKIAAATQQTSADYLKPLFKSLRKRDLAADVLQAIAEITYNMQMREYLRANDAYLRLSIGNAPWPIGVTMVGIHERSGREKIFSNNVAHVLNDETSRKYIQSIKRLLTFAQTVRPPDDLSQKMG